MVSRRPESSVDRPSTTTRALGSEFGLVGGAGRLPLAVDGGKPHQADRLAGNDAERSEEQQDGEDEGRPAEPVGPREEVADERIDGEPDRQRDEEAERAGEQLAEGEAPAPRPRDEVLRLLQGLPLDRVVRLDRQARQVVDRPGAALQDRRFGSGLAFARRNARLVEAEGARSAGAVLAVVAHAIRSPMRN